MRSALSQSRVAVAPIETDRCAVCGAPIASLADAWLQFSDATTGRYPHDPATLTAALTHAACGPDTGYPVALRRLLRDGVGDEPTSWTHHLRRKRWWSDAFIDVLAAAHALAGRLERGARVTAPRGPTSPRLASAPSTPNPRNISTRMRTRVMERDGFRCRRCGAGPDEERLVVDHIVAVARGGTGDESNLQTLCAPCNAGKSDRPPHPHDLEAR